MIHKISHNTNKYGSNISTLDWLKFLAIVTMTIDHIGVYFCAHNSELYFWFRSIGRIHVPVWFFFAGYCARPTKLISYKDEILWLGIILIIINVVGYRGIFPLNNLISILIARNVVLWLNQRDLIQRKLFDIVLMLAIFSPLSNMLFEYGSNGILYAIMGDMVRRGQHHRRFFSFCLGFFLLYQYAGLMEANIWQIGLMIVGISVYHMKLTNFEMKNIEWFDAHQRINLLVRAFSRNSLYYYAFHRALFTIIAQYAAINAVDKFPIFGLFGY
jgi:hypothetical protein